MKIFEYRDRINTLHKLISEKRTGTPEELANRLNISIRRLHDILDDLKLIGAPIAYTRQSRTYFYTFPYKIDINISFEPLKPFELKTINGGSNLLKKNIVFFFNKLSFH